MSAYPLTKFLTAFVKCDCCMVKVYDKVHLAQKDIQSGMVVCASCRPEFISDVQRYGGEPEWVDVECEWEENEPEFDND